MNWDEVLEELLELEKDVKPKLKRIEEIKSWCKEKGSFHTDKYVCSVQTRTRTCLVSLEKATLALGKTMLESFNLIQESVFKVVSVSENLGIKENLVESDI